MEVSSSSQHIIKISIHPRSSIVLASPIVCPARSAKLSEDDSSILSITEQRSGQPSMIRIFPINREDPTSQTTSPSIEINITQTGPRATVALFAPLADYMITGHDSGKIGKYDTKTGEMVKSVQESHSGEITDIQLSPDGTYFITSSKDKSAKVGLGRVFSWREAERSEGAGGANVDGGWWSGMVIDRWALHGLC